MRSKINIYLIIGGVLISILSGYAQNGLFTDPRDGKQYKTVQIGNQTWMAQNLAYTPVITYLFLQRNDTNSGIYCIHDDTTLLKQLGALYTWDAANISCPIGWHLSTKADFDTLIALYSSEDRKSVYEALKVGGISGFECALGGILGPITSYGLLGEKGCFWTSTPGARKKSFYCFKLDSRKKMHYLYYTAKLYYRNHRPFGFSVRCVKDN